MPQVDFSNFHYYPALRCTAGEHLGYRRLSDDDKLRILPIFELSQRRHEPDLTTAKTEIHHTSAGHPFILDLCKDRAPPPFVPSQPSANDEERIERQARDQHSYNQLLHSILDPTDGFACWRALVQEFPNCVPMLQFTDANRQSLQLLRQASLLSRDDSSIAIRITSTTDAEAFGVIAQILSILQSAGTLLVVIDCGQGRQRRADRISFAVSAISSIVGNADIDQWSNLRIVCMSSSFPSNFTDGLRVYAAHDWAIWRETRQTFPVSFGDYAAMHRFQRQNTFVPSDWRATVVYPTNEGWVVYRHPNANDVAGWIRGAQQIMSHPAYDRSLDSWGVRQLERAADDDLTEADRVRFWHAAKVNMHLRRQLLYPPPQESESDDAAPDDGSAP